ncbi:MAG: YjiH family protein [Calditrichaeota bacterium]|nr:MAG: YjiH family protein [Calditrichota bacterium]
MADGQQQSLSAAALRFVGFSLVGIGMFFLPVSLGGRSSIPLDHLISGLRRHWPMASAYYALGVLLAGTLLAGWELRQQRSPGRWLWALLCLLGLAAGLLRMLHRGPAWLTDPEVLPFLYDKLSIPVGLIVPVGAIFLAFLVDYGLLEFFGVLMEPVMRPLFHTPGRSAIDALASFVGSYSIGLLITNRVYLAGRYTAREAAIIATGFSTVSVTFMVIVARTCGLMGRWNLFFWTTLLVTFAVTALTVRLWPLRHFEQTNRRAEKSGTGSESDGSRLARAWRAALEAAGNAPPLQRCIWTNLKDGLAMVVRILPGIMSVGLLGLLAARHTPLFDWLGVLFWPVAVLAGLPEPLLAAKATALEVAEMFLPALLVNQAAPATRFAVAVMSIASILFFSASIPCILSTRIPLRIPQLLVIWLERAALSLLLAGLLARMFF